MRCKGCDSDADSLRCTVCGARNDETGNAEFSIEDEEKDAAVAAAVAGEGLDQVVASEESNPEETETDRGAGKVGGWRPSFGMFGGVQ